MKTAEEILTKAADLIEKGWCQGQLAKRDMDGRIIALCLGGALLAVDGAPLSRFADHTLSLAGQDAISALKQEVGGSLIRFNDRQGRTMEEAAAACRNSKRWL